MIHLSYHDGEHYNSVRLKEDPCDGPARPITIKADADLSATSHQPKVAVSKFKEGPGQNIETGSIKLVMAGTACGNADKIVEVLHELGGDVDAAIEFLVAEQGMEECLVENDKVHSQSETSYGDNENGNFEAHEELENDTDGQVLSTNSIKTTPNDWNPQKDDKKISRNKVCPCGSRKKYKACCGSVAAGKSSTKFAVNQALLDSTTTQRERKQGKKGRLAKAAPAYTYRDNGAPPDMGALCI